MFHSDSGALENIIRSGNHMEHGGASGLVVPLNAPQAQSTNEQLWHNIEQGVTVEDHHNILSAQRSGKQQQLRDAGIAGKRRANESEQQQQLEIWGEERSQQGGNVAGTAVNVSRTKYVYDNSKAKDFINITKSDLGVNFFTVLLAKMISL
jgi:hypothetical protein